VRESRIVVGLDGCGSCQAALRYAIEEARRRGCDLVIVVAYEADSDAAGEGLADGAQAMAQRCLEQAGVLPSAGGLMWQIVVKEMPPVDALAAAAHSAGAIVVGRHHGQPAGDKLVGSTTRHLVEHSPVPVISVPRGYR
jgi:nucleotide-binding universal stress UspA family protein